jgi:hypothetical protein
LNFDFRLKTHSELTFFLAQNPELTHPPPPTQERSTLQRENWFKPFGLFFTIRLNFQHFSTRKISCSGSSVLSVVFAEGVFSAPLFAVTVNIDVLSDTLLWLLGGSMHVVE